MKTLNAKTTGIKALLILLFIGVTNNVQAQSKSSLIKEFEILNKKSLYIYEKSSDRFDKLDTKWKSEIEKYDVEGVDEIIEEFAEEDFNLDKEFSTEEEMTLFVKDYEDRFPKTSLPEVLNTLKAERAQALSEVKHQMDKDYINLSYDVEVENTEIKNKMYLTAKKATK